MDTATAPDARLRRIPSRLLSLTAAIGRGLLVERLATRDLRLGHLATLEIIDARPGCAQRDVSRYGQHDPSDVVALVDELAARGWVVREVDPADRRRRALRLTPQGQEALAWCRTQVAAATEAFLAPLEPAEREQLVGLLERLLAAQPTDRPDAC